MHFTRKKNKILNRRKLVNLKLFFGKDENYLVVQPRWISFVAVSGLTHAGTPVVDLKISSRFSLQDILSGLIPLLICTFGEGSTKQLTEYKEPRP